MNDDARDTTKLLGDALTAIRDLKQRLEEARRAANEPIAIVGMGCRFPGGARSPEALWELLESGRDAITRVPSDRWDADDLYDPDPDSAGHICTRDGGFLEDVAAFDPQFFRISPREAMFLDPQHRALLEVTWEALEDACISPDALYGTEAGVFVGMTCSDYASLVPLLVPVEAVEASVGTGNAHSTAAGRISYVLGLTGPSLAIDTACSSALVAVHLAVESLRRRECSTAIAGGVHLMFAPGNHIVLSRAHMLSPEGRCRTFDDAANGYVRSEGIGLVVLKRLADALRDGDNVLAVIRGSAVNQDGPSGGLTVPSGPAQSLVIRRALANGAVDASEIGYVEAHGTGTALGDPIELNALGDVFAKGRDRSRPLWVGSLKSNIGHTEAAAGAAALIKLVLQLRHARIAPNLHFEKPTPRVDWEQLPLRVATSTERWEGRRIGGVSSFGFSGTNAHVVVEAAPLDERPRSTRDRSRHIVALSGKTEGAAARLAEAFAEHFERNPDLDAGDLGFSCNAGRSHFDHRVVVVGASTAELATRLREVGRGELSRCAVRAEVAGGARKVAFLFAGQGAQYVGMGRELYETHPTFRRVIDRCDAVLRAESGFSLVEALYAADADAALVHQTAYSQPLLYALEVALAQLWISWGVEPAALMGHSVGEYAAACIAGVFDMEDGLRLIAARGRLMQALPRGGGMLAVFCNEETARARIASFGGRVAIAAINTPTQVVLSGETTALDELAAAFTRNQIKAIALDVSHAFHSPLVEPMLADFARVAEGVEFRPARIDVISNVTGARATSELSRAAYWIEHVRAPVRFRDGVEALSALGCNTFVEVGPKATLTPLGRACLAHSEDVRWIASLAPDRSDWEQILGALGELYAAGVAVSWASFDRDYERRKIAGLPTYSFERDRYWFPDYNRALPRAAAPRPLLGRRAASHDGRSVVFESEVGEGQPGFLSDHRVFKWAVFPAAGFVEMALAAGAEALGVSEVALSDVSVVAPLALESDEKTHLRTTLEPKEDGGFSFAIQSRAAGDAHESSWRLHARGSLARGDSGSAALGPVHLRDQLPIAIEPDDFYALSARRGLAYGETFRLLTELRGSGEDMLARIDLPDGIADDAAAYAFHPTVLDAALQTVGIALLDIDETYLPMRLGAVRVWSKPRGRCWAHLRRQPGAIGPLVTVDLVLFDETGKLLAQIEGLTIVRTTNAGVKRLIEGDPTELLYRFGWSRRPLPAARDVEPKSGAARWLVFADRAGVGARVAQTLVRRGAQCTLVVPKAESELGREGETFHVDPTCPTQLTALLAEARRDGGLDGILYAWGLDGSGSLGDEALSLESSQLLGCGPLLNLAKAVVSDRSLPICVLTRGACAVARNGERVSPDQAAILGFVNTFRVETASNVCTHVDLDLEEGRRSDDVEAHQIAAELLAPDGEDSVALRSGLRYIYRWRHWQGAGVRETGKPIQVTFDEYGSLDRVHTAPLERRPPGPGEIEVRVRAGALNFKDVVHVMGLLKAHAESAGLPWVDRRSLGFECAGVVEAIGEGVTDRKPGDRVVVTGYECLRSFVVVPASHSVVVPPRVSFVDAAALPSVTMTAYYALEKLAHVRRGDRVLVHAAAGGVGQAAIRICQRLGAEVFATASRPKWDFLRSVGVRHIMDSRTTDFEADILEATGGRGVDVVVNSLGAEFIAASVSALAPGGRFVEIGKLDIWTKAQMAAVRPDVAYHVFDMSELPQELVIDLLRSVGAALRAIASGEMAALPAEVHPASEVVAAFRLLAQGRSVGKVVLEMPPLDDERETTPRVRDDGCYVVTGGLGGLGLKVAEWLAEEGARNLVLVGRSAPSVEAAATIERLRASGAWVMVASADVADAARVDELFAEIARAELGPVRGVMHAAGVLDDALIGDETWARFAKVMAPKVLGGWNLHRATRALPLDFFVAFSSLSTLAGWAGQGNYGAANGFLDALMFQRRAEGLPGQTINWGAWASVGMAAGLSKAMQKKLTARGASMVSVRSSLAALGYLLRHDVAQAGFAKVDWARFQRGVRLGGPARVLEHVIESAASGKSRASESPSAFRARLDAAPMADRRRVLTEHFRGQLAHMLGFPSPDRVQPRHRLYDLGLDSLSAVELRNHTEAAIGRPLPATLLFDFPTLEALVNHLHDEVLGSAALQ